MRHLIILLLQFVIILPAISKTIRNNTFLTESKFIHDVCISSAGKVLICTDNLNLKAFEIKTRKLLAEFKNGHSGKVLTVDISSDSTMIASGGRDSIVVIWNTQTQTVVERLNFTKGKVCSVKFSPDSKFLAIGCSNAKAYLYSVIDKKCIYTFENQQNEFVEIAYNKYGNLLAITGADKSINIYNTNNYNKTFMLNGHKDLIRSLVFFNDGNNIISCSDDCKVMEWKISSNKLIKNEKTSNGGSWNICLDIENKAVDNYNMHVVGTMNGKLAVNSLFAKYVLRLKSPINQVKIIPRNDNLIEVIAATLGSGLFILKADNMKLIE